MENFFYLIIEDQKKYSVLLTSNSSAWIKMYQKRIIFLYRILASKQKNL